MPRAETQNIPPALLADYLKTLGPTRYDNTFYGGNPAARDIIGIRYPARSKNTRNPSQLQLSQRAIFKACANGFFAMPYNEQAAYYEAARGSDMYFYDFAMSRNIRAMIAGATWSQISRPRAIRFDYDNNPACANLSIASPIGAGGTFRWDVEAFAASDIATCSEIKFYQFQLVIFGRLWTNGSYHDTPWKSFNLPVGRSTGSQSIVPFPPPPRFQRVARIWRHSDSQAPFVVWDLSFQDAQPELTLTGFLQ